MFGRRAKTADSSTPSSGATAMPPGADGSRGGKGRPTPKRSAAEQARRQGLKPASDRREAYRKARQEARAARERRRAALLSGDERYLPRRDQGPVRAFVRDYVDARRSVGEYFIVLALMVLVASILAPPLGLVEVANAAFLLWTVALVLIIVDSVVLGIRLRRALRQRFPDEERRGAVAYGLMRSTQLRRLRLPRPRVRPGATV